MNCWLPSPPPPRSRPHPPVQRVPETADRLACTVSAAPRAVPTRKQTAMLSPMGIWDQRKEGVVVRAPLLPRGPRGRHDVSRGAGPARLLATGRDLGGGLGYPGPNPPGRAVRHHRQPKSTHCRKLRSKRMLKRWMWGLPWWCSG